VGCFCIGTNQVDLKAAKMKGVPVFNAPFSNTRSVAEVTLALIIGLFRHLFDHNQNTHQGIWNKSAEGSREIRGKILGVVGYGHIGKQLGALAENLGMQVLYYDITNQLSLGNAKSTFSLDELLTKSDVVSLHVPQTEQTNLLMGKSQFEKMQKGSFLINLSRGKVVDIDALKNALISGHLKGAALDVFPKEPSTNEEKFYSPLQGMKNVVLTPHIAGSTEEAQINIGKEVAQKLVHFLTTGSTVGAVNFHDFNLPLEKNRTRYIHIHQNTPGVLALVNEIFSSHRVNILGQYLQTDAEIGYAVIDCESLSKELRNEIKSELRKIKSTLRTYPIY